MILDFYNILFSFKSLLSISFALYLLLIFYWKSIFNLLQLKAYKSIQKVHHQETSRLGGFVIYIFFSLSILTGLIDNSFFFNIMLSSIPLVLIGLKEDLYQNTSPKFRLLIMLFSCLIFFYINPLALPIVKIPFFNFLTTNYYISIVFYTFSILVLINGMNLIDGMNGLCGFTTIFIILSLWYLAIISGDSEMVYLMSFTLLPLLIFIIFNFPFGKVFLGDFGAYFMGFILSLLTIRLFGKNPELISWKAILILFYPCMELLFSYVRKYLHGISPFTPDDKHLHTLVFKKIEKIFGSNIFSNPSTTFVISFFWIIPPILGIYLENVFNIALGLLVLTTIYLLLYRIVK